MAGPSPELKSNELAERVRRIVDWFAEKGILNEIAWQGAFNDSLELEGTPSEPSALISRGVLLSLKQDNAGVDLTFSVYADRYGADWSWHLCRASIAMNLGRPKMIADMIRFGVPEGDIAAHESAFNYSGQSGFFVSASDYAERLKSMKADMTLSDRADYLSEVAASGEYLRALGVDELDVAERISAAWLVVSSEAKVTGKVDLSANEEGISYNFCIEADIPECLRVQKLMDRALIDKFEDPLFEHLSVGVYPG